MRIVVTGGAGFIGSHVVDAYLAGGHEVVVLDSLWAHGGGRRENVPQAASFIHLDIRDEDVERVFREYAPEVVSHHAAQQSVAISARDPRLDAEVNILGLINVLECAAKTGVRKIVFASSGATYGEPERLPITDATPQNPESPYAITKARPRLHGPALRQRLRPAPGPIGRGWGRRHLRRALSGARRRQDFLGRRTDARLYLRRRHRRA
jgi:UDP-glucose 4-epimerase